MSGGRRSSERSARVARVRRAGMELVVLVLLVAVVGALAAVSLRGSGTEPVMASRDADATPTRPTVVAAVTTPFGDGGRWSSLPVASSGELAPVDVSVAVTRASSARTWRGVGAALTDASVALLAGRSDALALLFDPAVVGGAALDIVRLPLSATDFSQRAWTWTADGAAAQPSPEAVAAVDLLDEVVTLRPDLAVIAAPWTSPPAMRTDPAAAGGTLVDVVGYGALLAEQVAWLVERGVPLTAVSLGNEPGHVTDAPTLAMSDDQMVALARSLRDPLDAAGVELFALDHNWSDAGRAAELVATGEFDAVAFHCYDGDATAMAGFELPVLVTECTAATGAWHSSVGWMARELVGDSIRAGSTGLLMWNLALDPSHGPKRPGGCEDCRGLLTVDPVTDTVATTPELSVLAHLSAAADPGASILDVDEVDGLPLAAFENPDATIGLFGHNDTPAPVSLEVHVGDDAVRIDVPSWGIFSVRVHSSSYAL